VATPGFVEIRQLRCQGRVGETDALETLLVDVGIALDLGPVASSDAYEDVVDLSALAATVRAMVARKPWLLLETVAVQTARAILHEYPSVASVRLRVAKPEPPGLDAAEESVELTLQRDSG
jgi:dihydroneopterin aldolase